MSDLSLIDIVNLIRAEIARTEIGDTKKITGPQGEKGAMGDTGPQGPQGPRGNDGKQGPAGIKGNQGKKGDKGVKGADGSDGVGIARVEQDIDNAIIVYLTDGNSYTIEMPLIQDDGSLAKEVHFKSGGGSGGSGVIDLSHYVKRPNDAALNDKWLVYKETADGNQGEWAVATTDLIETNPNTFRDKKGRFAPPPEELDGLTDQRAVNEFLWKYAQDGGDTQDRLLETVEEGLQLQSNIQQEIDLLNDKVASLEGAVGEHSLLFTSTNANPRAGEFNLKDSGYQIATYLSDAEYITLSQTDREGHYIDLDRIVVGDVLRLSDISKMTAELKVTQITDGNIFTFKKLSGDLERFSEGPYDFLLLSSFDPTGLATIDYVDERDDTKLDKSGGTVTGNLTVNANQTIISGAESTSTGNAIFKVLASGPTGRTVLEISNNGAMRLHNASGNTLMASSEDEPMTKKATEYRFNQTHALWKYMGVESTDIDAGDLNQGEFALRFSGSGEGKKVYIYLSNRDNNGHYWYGRFDGKEYEHGHATMVSISNATGVPRLTAKSTSFKFNQSNKPFFRCTGEYVKENFSLTRWTYYTCNFPGLLPLPVYSAHWNNSGQSSFMIEEEDQPYVAPENEPNVMGTDPDEKAR